MSFVRLQVTDDKKLHQTLKRLGLQSLQGIDEVNLFREDDSVIHFASPKLQAAIQVCLFLFSSSIFVPVEGWFFF